MKKIIFAITIFLLGILNVNAKNKINSIDITIDVRQDASAHIVEVWNVDADEKTKITEVYKPMDIEKSDISNFKVSEGTTNFYEVESWNINASFKDKAYKYGINRTSAGIELCWGISTYGAHSFKIEYDVKDFVRGNDDGEMIYWQLINDQISAPPKHVSVVISGPTNFSDDLPVWGYGYKGLAYVYGGKIYMESEKSLTSSEYVVLYATFDKGTFDVSKVEKGTTEEWLKRAEEGTYKYKPPVFEIIFVVLAFIFPVILVVVLGIAISKAHPTGSMVGIDYGAEGPKIKMKDINYFRDIPCKKDIFRAYFVANLYGLQKKKEDFLGTVFLKWLDEGRITIVETPPKFLSKSKNSIDLREAGKKEFSYALEKELYDMLLTASQDGILESKEFEKWCTKNYSKILGWFDKVIKEEKQRLTEQGLLVEYEKVTLKIFKTKVHSVTPELRNEAIELAGLKKFLVDFSEMKNKEAIEVHLWKQYLMYSQIFGIASKVAKQFKDLYPDLISDPNLNYDGIIFVNNIAYAGTSHAATARSRAESYSSGGGGFSSGGGGGGSFGGGHGGGFR